MAKRKVKEPKLVRPDDIDPHYRWDRPLQAPGHTQVDFEERVDFRRLHDYRLARTRAELDLDARSVRPHDDGHASDARGLWGL